MEKQKILSQTWQEFERDAIGKKIILFGAGKYANRYFNRYGEHTVLDGVIDNSIKKQGCKIQQFMNHAFVPPNANVKISGISILEKYDSESVLVLVSSKDHYETIIQQVEEFGISCCYVMACMEVNEEGSTEEKHIPITDEQRKQFANMCCTQYEINENKIFFNSYGKYTDHGKYITEALLRIRDDLDIVWVLSNLEVEVPSGIRKVYSGNWKQYIYEMETSKVWVLNLELPFYIEKRQGQVYFQTKHWASITLKRFYLDTVAFSGNPERIINWKRDGQLMDYVITGSEFDAASCRRGFGFQGRMLQFGSPRSDGLFLGIGVKNKVYHYYGIEESVHTLLYAPTYRFDKVKGHNFHVSKLIEMDFKLVKRALERRFGGEWQIMLRLHPSVAAMSKNMEYPDFVVDASEYEDSEELVAAADVTISDFSSIMFEPAFIKRPVFLFVTDKDDYLDQEYDLLIDYDTLPFPIAESNEELVHKIEMFDEKQYRRNVTEFLEKYGVNEDGHASERAAAYISQMIDNNTKIVKGANKENS